jgi:hypothetical protein
MRKGSVTGQQANKPNRKGSVDMRKGSLTGQQRRGSEDRPRLKDQSSTVSMISEDGEAPTLPSTVSLSPEPDRSTSALNRVGTDASMQRDTQSYLNQENEPM